ncbi:unnamed protein product [Nippostrongylus brasiliensis]|uniref:EGF-like domain-containing protein n=1 Tax=Nippostrongylus brasiliensis TaxID=27835 RepID=A0A0N4XKL7_NIPBR|nr:unnamed protein product [Nippostrongylus brasiliensis]
MATAKIAISNLLEGKIFVYEELPSLSVSVALSATTIDDGNSETLCTTLADNTCSCESGKYSGDFCEISSLNCTSSPQLPYLANEVSTMILVVERYYTPLQLTLTSAVLKALLGINTIVVYYGGGLSPSVVFSSTNSQLLPDVLQQIQQFNTSAPAESPYDAIELALKSQVQ